MVGLELRDSDAVAVAVDDNGHVMTSVTSGGTDLAAAALAALGTLPISALGAVSVAAINPQAPGAAAAVRAVAAKFDGLPAELLPVASGTAASAAEAWIGAARGKHDVVYFGVAEHTTAGILHDGRAMTGVNGRAPAVAWLALNPVEREDYRKAGCLEAEVAASGIVRRLVWRIKAGDHSRVQDIVGDDLTAITVRHILDAARGGDGVSISVMRDTAKYLGMAAANLVAVSDPEILVLGGIMASSADLLFEPVRTELARRLPPAMIHTLAIAPAVLGTDAAAIGATRLSALGLA